MRNAGVDPRAHARVAIVAGQREAFVIFQKPETLEERREHGLRPTERFEQEGAGRRVFQQEIVQQGILLQHVFPQDRTARGVLVHQPGVALAEKIGIHPRQHVFHRTPVRVALGDRMFRIDVLEVLQDDQAFLDDVSIGRFQHRQCRGAAGLFQQPVGTLLGDVDHLEVDFVAAALQRQQDVQPLAERADGDVVNDGLAHGWKEEMALEKS